MCYNTVDRQNGIGERLLFISKNIMGGYFMKKKVLATCLAGAFCASAFLGLVGCGDGGKDPVGDPSEPEKIDGTAPAFDQADVTVSLTGGIDKTTASKQISSDLFGLFLKTSISPVTDSTTTSSRTGRLRTKARAAKEIAGARNRLRFLKLLLQTGFLKTDRRSGASIPTTRRSPRRLAVRLPISGTAPRRSP